MLFIATRSGIISFPPEDIGIEMKLGHVMSQTWIGTKLVAHAEGPVAPVDDVVCPLGQAVQLVLVWEPKIW